jgi:uncharacterized membrane protein YesL
LKAFSITWRALVSYYDEFFFLVGMSLLWWVTGGMFAGAALVAGWILASTGGPWWLAPLLAIPAGPASAAMANVARQVARDLSVNRTVYFGGLRSYWRRALAVSAIGMVILSLLLLNAAFYASQHTTLMWAITFFWAYLSAFWILVQVYQYPVLVGMENPKIFGVLRISLAIVFASPIFSILLLAAAAVLSVICLLLAVTLFVAWPAVMILLGEHSVKFYVDRATQKPS